MIQDAIVGKEQRCAGLALPSAKVLPLPQEGTDGLGGGGSTV